MVVLEEGCRRTRQVDEGRRLCRKNDYPSIGYLESFYRWCLEHQVDPACEAGFNPASGVTRLQLKPFEESKLFSRNEANALLEVIKKDQTLVGKRNYALILARCAWGYR
ncbi:MAG: hypothetical protein EHM41_25375 [Chloroflexi bacterium]|nr:MAG: hypothetical protein EHM41_25375 [Chloroflexota bacterium]